MNTLHNLEKVIAGRREGADAGSYTAYLFDKGLDKMLKKLGEECSEVIIAAKNGIKADTINEIADLVYHLMVVMNEQGIELNELLDLLDERAKKAGNLKQPVGSQG